ncbi:MAG: hypothetical protein CMJ23_03140 [Phycisphaerae bacterium]|nr:hypothetical protein [Phycisphaerae bacterium]
MNIADRLKMYSALAAAPCAVIGGIPVTAFAAPDPGGVTAQLNGSTSSVSVDAFTAAGLQFQAFMFKTVGSAWSSGGLQLAADDRGSTYGGNFYGLASKMKFFAVDSNPQTISWNAPGVARSNSGYGGWSRASWSTYTNMVDTTQGSGYLGFSVQRVDTKVSTFVAGWIHFTLDLTLGRESYFTIDSWDFNTGDVTTSITMPASPPPGGSGAVPGIGGLAALAIGAAGVRSRRQRTVA